MSEVPDSLTKVEPAALYAALRAYTHTTGDPLSRASLLVLASQFAFETGGGKACHCWNIGNIKGEDPKSGGFCMFRCSEIIAGKEVFFDPPNPACKFRAYPSLEAGAADYYDELRTRFARAWPAVVAGDPDAFARELKAAGYYTADEAIYARGLQRWYAALDLAIVDPDPAAQAAADSTFAANANQGAVDQQFDPEKDHDGEADPNAEG